MLYFQHFKLTKGKPCFLFPQNSDTKCMGALRTPTDSPLLSRHELSVLQFNSDTNDWEWGLTPQVKGSFPQDCSPFQMPLASPRLSLVLLWVWWFARTAHRTQESTVFRIIHFYKEHNSATAKWKSCIGQGMWEGSAKFHASSRSVTLPSNLICPLPQKLSEPFWLGLLWRLCYVSRID